MDLDALAELGTGDVLAAFGELRQTRDETERLVLRLAAHYADRHSTDNRPADAGARLPGTEQPVTVAGAGAPRVWEFCFAELAAALHTTTHAARRLVGDAVEARHRLPGLWAGLAAGHVLAWRVRKVAQATRDLTVEQAGFVDAEVLAAAGDAVPAGRFFTILEGLVVAADPDAAAAREEAATAERFARVGQSNRHGTKTLYVRSPAAVMTRMDASIAYVAQVLRALGDTASEDHRRVKALLILMNPFQAAGLLQAYATHQQRARGDDTERGEQDDGDPDPDSTRNAAARRNAASSEGRDDDRPDPSAGAGNESACGDGRTSSESRAGSSQGSGVPAAGNGPAPPAPAAGWWPFDEALPLPEDPPDGDPDENLPPPPPDPADGGPRRAPGLLARFSTPFHPADVPPCGCRGGTWIPAMRDLMPRVTLYLHGYLGTFPTGTTGRASSTGGTGGPGADTAGGTAAATRDGAEQASALRSESGGGDAAGVEFARPVIRWEDEGPITPRYLRELLGPHCRFTIKPVVDPAGTAPVDSYEIPARHREALHLRTPADVFPFAPNTSRRKQIDHTRPYRHQDVGGTGQTGLGNLGGMTTYHHRVKTHAAGWSLTQPFPGTYLWRSPHGGLYLVDHTGTHQVRGPRNSAGYDTAMGRVSTASPLEHQLRQLVTA